MPAGSFLSHWQTVPFPEPYAKSGRGRILAVTRKYRSQTSRSRCALSGVEVVGITRAKRLELLDSECETPPMPWVRTVSPAFPSRRRSTRRGGLPPATIPVRESQSGCLGHPNESIVPT